MRPINRGTAAAINKGMSEHEVEAFVGAPPGNYATRKVQWEGDFEETMRSWWHSKEWVSDEGMIVVRFGDTTRQVLSVEFRDVFEAPHQHGFFNRVLGWFRHTAAK
jgi:hypothetical protein